MSLADYIHEKPVIETERLTIRRMVPSDIPALKEWLPDPALYTYWGKGPGKSEKNPELLFERAERPTSSLHLGIALKDTGRVIGDLWVYLIVGNRMATTAIRIGGDYQRQGYGTEALSAITRFCFEHTELRRLQAEIDLRNTASQRLFEKCGYTCEGLIRQGRMVNSWCDYRIYGILSTD